METPTYPAGAPLVGFVPTPTGKGYWMILADGAVFGFGDAEYHGRLIVEEKNWR